MGNMTKEKRMQLIPDKLEANGKFKHQQAEWERQAHTGRNQTRADDVCKTTFACTKLGSSAAILTVVISLKSLTKSVAVARLNNQHKMKAGQGTGKCGLPADIH